MRWLTDRYASIDPRSLGLFRIVFGGLLISDLARRVPDLVMFYTEIGIVPSQHSSAAASGRELFSIYNAFATPGQVAIAFAVTFLVYALYTVGFRTRLMQVLALFLVTSLHARSTILENGGDVVMNLLAAWTVFLPLGR